MTTPTFSPYPLPSAEAIEAAIQRARKERSLAVGRFIAALFSVGADAEALAEATRAYDVLFRFKIDFVRRRALPLLKGGAHVEAGADDHALAEEIMQSSSASAGTRRAKGMGPPALSG